MERKYLQKWSGFFIGGDGTHRGIKALSKILKQKKEKVILVGIPKTIDNDIPIIDKSFGLDTAVESVYVIRAADVEANCNPNGIGLVKYLIIFSKELKLN